MEGLTGVTYHAPIMGGPIEVELTFLDPPAHIIDLLEYAMLNELTVPVGTRVPGVLSPVGMRILEMDVQSEWQSIDYNFGASTKSILRHRHLTVRARPA